MMNTKTDKPAADGGGLFGADGLQEDGPVVHTPARGWMFLVAGALITAFWAYWAIRGAGGGFDAAAMLESARELASHPLAPFAMLPVFVAGSFLIAPLIGMVAACALLFDPWTASATAITGTLLVTASNHWVGVHFGNAIAPRVPRRVADRIQRIAASSDTWSLAALRLIPIGPFTIVNVIAGAAGVRLRPFMLGTFIATAPAIVLVCLSVDRALAALSGEPVFEPWIVAAIASAGLALIALRLWLKRGRR